MDKQVKAVLWTLAIGVALFFIALAYSLHELKQIG